MEFFKANWNLQGFRDKLTKAGEVIEADFEEVKEFVAKEFGGLVEKVEHAVLSPFDGDPSNVNADDETLSDADAEEMAKDLSAGGEAIDVSKMRKKADVIAFAQQNHPELQLDPDGKLVDLVAAVKAAQAAKVADANLQGA